MTVPDKSNSVKALPASFRDPSGFVFVQDGALYRQVNIGYKLQYDRLMSSGLYERLVKKGLLISHQEVQLNLQSGYKVIQPEHVRFISYPFEWSFSQLRDAALTTMKIQKIALEYGMSLKDASAYNIQFHKGRATLIDTLSFEFYQDGEPWVAYRQFCQHFLAPLALMAKTDVRLGNLLRIHIDGVPLDLASRLLPFSTYFNLGLLAHIHLHSQAQIKYADKKVEAPRLQKKIEKEALTGLVEHLETTIKNLKWRPGGTEWADYYEITNYSSSAFENKKNIILGWLQYVSPKLVWDLGANNGEFTRLASSSDIQSVAFDIDPAAVEKNYLRVKQDREQKLLPLVMDLTNPSPAIGWHNQERSSLLERGPVDMVFALAIVHHLAISHNVPLEKLANFFSNVCKWLIIEFIPKTDSQVKKLLANRTDIFEQYNQTDFENIFEKKFILRQKMLVQESDRVLYLMETRH